MQVEQDEVGRTGRREVEAEPSQARVDTKPVDVDAVLALLDGVGTRPRPAAADLWRPVTLAQTPSGSAPPGETRSPGRASPGGDEHHGAGASVTVPYG